jgi:hypothetical protein
MYYPKVRKREAAFRSPPQGVHPAGLFRSGQGALRRQLDARGTDRGGSFRYDDSPNGLALDSDARLMLAKRFLG